MKRHLKNIYKIIIQIFYQIVYWALCYIPVFKLYQPVFGQKISQKLIRECEDRWAVFSKYFPETKGSVLDIGCNLGYFSFKSAELGHFSYGIESDDFNITCCNAIKNANNIDNCVFVKNLLTPEDIKRMPHFDTVINLSVFHHWVKAFGAEQAQEMMQNLANKCNTLIFETGQPNEIGSQWPEHLAFMGEQPDQWIKEFLQKIGFNTVEMIGTFPTGLTNVERYLFSAKK